MLSHIKDESCIFCKIANGEIPTNTLYDDENFRVILDQSPATRGHALIMPKDHYTDLYDMPQDKCVGTMRVVQWMAVRMKEKLKCDGFNIVQNNGACAGQSVFHFHMHLIPRYLDDGQEIAWKPLKTTPEELEEVRQQIVGFGAMKIEET